MKSSLALLAAVSVAPAIETGGLVRNACSAGPFTFTFSALPDTCSIDMPEPRCPQVEPADLSYARGFLRAPGGIMDYGRLEDIALDREIAVPSAGYEDSVPFHPRRLYALRVGERGFALFAEIRNFIGGCLHQEFRWRYNASSNHFREGFPIEASVGVRAKGEERSAVPAGPPAGGFDAQGRALPASPQPMRPAVLERFRTDGSPGR